MWLPLVWDLQTWHWTEDGTDSPRVEMTLNKIIWPGALMSCLFCHGGLLTLQS